MIRGGADYNGRMTLHSAQIGPGPLIRDLMPLMRVSGVPVSLKEESVTTFESPQPADLSPGRGIGVR